MFLITCISCVSIWFFHTVNPPIKIQYANVYSNQKQRNKISSAFFPFFSQWCSPGSVPGPFFCIFLSSPSGVPQDPFQVLSCAFSFLLPVVFPRIRFRSLLLRFLFFWGRQLVRRFVSPPRGDVMGYVTIGIQDHTKKGYIQGVCHMTHTTHLFHTNQTDFNPEINPISPYPTNHTRKWYK